MGESDAPSRRYLPLWVGITEVLGIVLVVVTTHWLVVYYKGLNWGPQIFNNHPFYMVLGLVFVYGNGIMFYRMTPNMSKPTAKKLHALVNLLSLIFTVVALVAVFKALAFSPNKVYSLHSWVGMATVVLFASQWVLGFVTFLFPGLAMSQRAWYLPIHQWLGVGTFAIAIAATLMGLTEKTFGKVDALSAENYVINLLGMLLLCFGLGVGYVVTCGPFARPAEDNYEALGK